MVANKRDALWFPKQEDSCNAAIDWDVIFICALSTENIVPTVSSNKTLPRSFKFKDPSETDRCLLNNVSSINQIFYGDWGYNQIKKYLPVLISTSFLSKSWKRVLYFICVSNVHVCVHVFSFDANWPNSLKKSGVQTSETKKGTCSQRSFHTQWVHFQCIDTLDIRSLKGRSTQNGATWLLYEI